MTLRTHVLTGFRWTAGAPGEPGGHVGDHARRDSPSVPPSDYGLLAMATVLIAVLATFSEFGLGAAVVQNPDIDERLLRRVFGVILIIHFSLASIPGAGGAAYRHLLR